MGGSLGLCGTCDPFGWPFLAKVSGLGLPKVPAVETTVKTPWFRRGWHRGEILVSPCPTTRVHQAPRRLAPWPSARQGGARAEPGCRQVNARLPPGTCRAFTRRRTGCRHLPPGLSDVPAWPRVGALPGLGAYFRGFDHPEVNVD